MKTKSLLLLVAALLVGTISYTQVKISAEIRPRSEYSHGVKKPAGDNQDASIRTSQRTRLNLSYKNESFAVGVVMQDVRLWGTEPQLTSNGNNVTYLHQAWAEWFIDPQFSLKAGRQELVYDDHRILGSVGWAQQARSHDVALFKYTGDVNVHMGIAYHNSNLHDNFYEGPDAYKAMQFLWINRKTDSYSGSILFLNNGKPYWESTAENDQGIRYSQTLGGHLNTTLDNVKLSGNLYYQFGEDAGGNDLSALNFAIDAWIKAGEKANIGLGYEILSGTDQGSTGKNKSFTPLYGTNHKFNGFMDYFYVGNHLQPGKAVGLKDLHIKGNIKPGKVKFNGALHFFSAHGDITGEDKALGTELDLWCGYSHKGQVQLDFGLSHMFAGDGIIALYPGSDKDASNNWAWVQLTFKPVLYKK